MDAIDLAGMSFYGYHGVHREERTLGQRFTVDIRLELDLSPAGRGDDLARTVDYGLAWKAVRDVVEGQPRQLIESVGEGIAVALLERFGAVQTVWVRVAKPWASIAGASSGTVAIELIRGRAALAATPADRP